MFYSSDLSKDLVSGNLTEVLEKASLLNKRVYQTDSKVCVLTPDEAKTVADAHIIGLNILTKTLLTNKDKLSLNVINKYSNALQVYAKTIGLPLKLNEEELKFTAETQGLGYKTANLDQVSLLCKEDFGSYRLKVPEYVGVSSSKIEEALLNYGGLDIAGKWKEIINKHFPTNSEKNETLQKKKLPPEFLADCAVFRQQIEEAMQRLSQNQDQELDKLFSSAGLENLVANLAASKERLMVRSTGKEDTKELANAGGNTSVPNVSPHRQKVIEAMKEVIISYFGEKSLKQRLGVGDPSLFDETSLTPVLIQRMIGERNPQALPKCGVMFTEDCQSKVASHAPTSGITVIQSAYGHNEGVVTSLIPVDSYYINDQGTIFPIIRPKTQRMMPTEKSGELMLVANSSKTASTPALSVEALGTLKNFAGRLEEFYGGAMDVEFVVDEQEKTIFIVQARPLVELKFGEASYLPEPHQMKQSEMLKGSAIGAAGGAVRLAKPSEIVVHPTLSGALDIYQELENPQEVSVIVVGKPAASTSHWATVFHNEGKPVLCLPELPEFNAWLQDPHSSILVSPQQGLAINLKMEKAPTLEDLQTSGTLVKGWVDYPAAPLISVCPQFQLKDKLNEKTLRAFYPTLLSNEKWEQFQKHAARFDFETLFQNLHHSQGETLQIGLAALLYKFQNVLAYHSKTLKLDQEQQKRVEAVQSYALMLAKSVLENGDCRPSDPTYCRKLLPLHFLHALIFSHASYEELVDGHSLTTMALQEMAEEKAIALELEKQGITLNSSYSLTLLRLGKIAMQKEIGKLYQDFVLKLDFENREKELILLADILIKLDKLDMLSSWLNLSFPKKPDILELHKDIKGQLPFFEKLAKMKEVLNALNVSVFAQPKSFHTQWSLLNKEQLDIVKSDLFAEQYKQADSAGKLACTSLMNKLVDQFDLAIKALEGSREYPQEKQLILFQTMLKGYSELAHTWHQQFGLSDEIGLRLKKASEVINKAELLASDLRFSKNFDVQAFGSQSGASFEVISYTNEPTTLEDAFSVIHQEMLAMMSILNKQAVGKELPLPSILKKTTEELSLGVLTGYDLTKGMTTLHFTHALREHGVQYHLSAKAGSDKAKLAVRFSTENQNLRWNQIVYFLITLKVFGKFDIGEFDLKSRGLGFTFNLDDKDNLKSLKTILSTIETASTEIAKPTKLGIPDMSIERASKMDNAQKNLKPFQDLRLVVQEFEKDCGIENMRDSQFLQAVLKNLVKTDPAFVEGVLKKCWQCKSKGPSLFFTSVLPELLLKAGHAESTIAAHALSMLGSKYSNTERDGLSLIHVIASENPKALPSGSTKLIFRFLANPEHKEIILFTTYEDAIHVCDALMKQGSEPEEMVQGLISLLTAKDQTICNNGLKVLDLLSKHRDNYSQKFIEQVVTELQKTSLPDTIKPIVETKLASIRQI